MAQTHYTPITVNSGQVPSTQTNFPVLLNVTDNRLRTIANGGNVSNVNGFDVRPYSDSGLTSALTYQLVEHNASTGLLVMRVLVASLADGSLIYLGYGDSAINTDGSSTSVWDADHILVWGMDDTVSGADAFQDSTANNNDGDEGGGATFSQSGKIFNAVSFDGVDNRGIVESLSFAGDLTISFWFSTTETPGGSGRFLELAQAADSGIQVVHNSDTSVRVDNSGGPTSNITSGTGLNDGNFHRVSVTRSGTTYTLYVDGSSQGTSGGTAPTYTRMSIGVGIDLATTFSNVKLDHVMLSDIARSANWLTTEYNNENDFATFATVGSEVAVGAGTVRLPSYTRSNLIWR